jgi:signal transduction histidine kinase
MNSESKPDKSSFSTIEIAFANQAHLRHELRSTLNAIIGYSEVLRNETTDSGLGEFQLGFTKLHNAGQRLLNAANAQLEASRLETGALEMGVERLSARLLEQLRAPIDEFLRACDQWLKRSEEQGRENYVADLQKIRSEGLKLIALLENREGALSASSGFREVAPVFRQTKAKAESAKTERGTVLVVEDNESNCDILLRQLHREGHVIFSASDGATALQMTQTRKFDLILLGVVLPEMNGYQVLERLKAEPERRDIPVIMISSLEGLDPVLRCLEMGAEDYLALPFNPVILKAKINACLEKKRLRDQERAHTEQMRLDRERQDQLLKELSTANWELSQTMEQLKAAQGQLIVQEKLASLGALTAGIAHEIKNPLNFVNNFAALSVEITDELKVAMDRLQGQVEGEVLSYIEELLGDIRQNAEKIREHGGRADSIVRNMLLHSRGQSGEWQPTDLNALLAEYLQLTYSGMRTQDSTFNATLETEFDQSIGRINAAAQDLGRVFLNVFNNACYAVHQKKNALGAEFSPTLSVRTRALTGERAGERAGKQEEQIEIRIRDNGPGIPAEAREKIFNPFFTTKPPGQGTGLGLSISYEIVVQQHHGAFHVETEPGEFTEFIITLPRNVE